MIQSLFKWICLPHGGKIHVFESSYWLKWDITKWPIGFSLHLPNLSLFASQVFLVEDSHCLTVEWPAGTFFSGFSLGKAVCKSASRLVIVSLFSRNLSWVLFSEVLVFSEMSWNQVIKKRECAKREFVDVWLICFLLFFFWPDDLSPSGVRGSKTKPSQKKKHAHILNVCLKFSEEECSGLGWIARSWFEVSQLLLTKKGGQGIKQCLNVWFL